MKLPFLNSNDSAQKIKMIPTEKIVPNPYQPRENFIEEDIRQLAESIKNFGLIQPLTVRPKEDKYELVAGERRLRAARYLGKKEIPAIIKDFSNQEAGEIALVENLQRKDLDFIEESLAYKTLLEEFDLTQKELAEKLGKNQSTIANKLRILNLPLEVRKQIKNSTLTERHARALLQLEGDLEKQLKIIEQIKENDLTVRETQKAIKEILADNGKKKKVITVCKDIRIFTNTLNKIINEMQDSGLKIEVNKKKEKKYIEYKIRLPRK